MRRRRSDELAAIDEVQPLVERFNELNQNQKMIFLDMVDPLPDEVEQKPTKKPKKKSGKSGGKSVRASGIATQLNRSLEAQRKRTDRFAEPGSEADDGDRDDNDTSRPCAGAMAASGQPCGMSQSNPIHDPAAGYAGYHEFVAPEQAVGVGGD